MEDTQNLTHKKCVPCEGGVEPLHQDEIVKYLGAVKGWTLNADKHITREYVFRDFAQALAFVNEVGKIAEEEGHHPDITLHGWNKVSLTLFTHAISGLHLNDFVLAAKINELKN